MEPPAHPKQETLFYSGNPNQVRELANEVSHRGGDLHTPWNQAEESLEILKAIETSEVEAFVDYQFLASFIRAIPSNRVSLALERGVVLYVWTHQSPMIPSLLRKYSRREASMEPLDIGVVYDFPTDDSRPIEPTDNDRERIVRIRWA